MTATSDERSELAPVRLGLPLLAISLGWAVQIGFTVSAVLNRRPAGRPVPELALILYPYAIFFVPIGLIWVLSILKPTRPKLAAQSLLLAWLAVSGLIRIVYRWSMVNIPSPEWNWRTALGYTLSVIITASAVWGLVKLQPWRLLEPSGEPVSPSTRRTQRLFFISAFISALAALVLVFGIGTPDGSSPLWSNSRNVAPTVAIIAIAVWLVAIALAWWWYFSADEHERKANDVAFLVGGGLFMAATPVWWIASRAGLAPPPDAMTIWYASMMAMFIGWVWYRNR
jgi:hypothetical protein